MSEPNTSAMRAVMADGMPAASVAAKSVLVMRAERVTRRRSSVWLTTSADHLPFLSDSSRRCGGVLPWLS